MSIDDPGASPRASRAGRIAAAVPASGLALAGFGAVLIAGIWLATIERVQAERVEAVESETTKNANLALAVEVHANQLFKGIDQFWCASRASTNAPVRGCHSPSSSSRRSRASTPSHSSA